MSEPRSEHRPIPPRTEVRKLLSDSLWERHPMAPKPDPAQLEEKRDALLAASTPDGKRVQLIVEVMRSKESTGFTVTVEPTGGAMTANPDLHVRFEVAGAATVRDGLKQLFDKMRAAEYSPEVSGLDL